MATGQRGFSAEVSSIILALGVSATAFVWFRYFPNYSPEQNWVRGLPGWLALGYITVQLWMLLDSALRIRPTSVIDAVLAIAPVVTGIVCAVLWMVDYLHLSLFQLNALAMLVVTGVVEFVSTLWVRNVVLQRGVSVMPHPETA
ncbi:MAG: hypothetical protein QOF14_3139 [Hyphomicrobiales bacterium]|jgi:hypothetical protein|nr:hypothetical protein [Hyphomicrobiales bacterium]